MNGMTTAAERAAFIAYARTRLSKLSRRERAELDYDYRRTQQEAADRRRLTRDPAWNNPDWTHK